MAKPERYPHVCVRAAVCPSSLKTKAKAMKRTSLLAAMIAATIALAPVLAEDTTKSETADQTKEQNSEMKGMMKSKLRPSRPMIVIFLSISLASKWATLFGVMEIG